MEDQQNENLSQMPITPVKNAMNYGAIVGLAMVIISILFYIMGQESSEWGAYVHYIILTLGMVLGIKHFRDNINGGYLSYGKCLANGVMIGFFASLITSFYSYVFFTFIDPSIIQVMLDQAEQNLIDAGTADEEIEMAMVYTKKFMTPLLLTVATLFSYTLLSFLFSLIISIFLKRNDDSFNGNFQ